MDVKSAGWREFWDENGISLLYPPDWTVVRLVGTTTVVHSPGRDMFILLEEIGNPRGLTAGQIVQGGQFQAAAFLKAPTIGAVEEKSGSSASLWIKFRLDGDLSDGILPAPDALRAGEWNVMVSCENFVGSKHVGAPASLVCLCAISASAANPAAVSRLWQISRTYCGLLVPILAAVDSPGVSGFYPGTPQPPFVSGQGSSRKTPPPPPPPPKPKGLTFQRFLDPDMGTFEIDIPQGWRARGGFIHAGLGDRRQWVEAQSPDGISLLFGDPGFPQIFCSNSMAWGENFIPYPQGVTFLNLKASAKRLAEYYLSKVAPPRIGAITLGPNRDRRDLADAGLKRHAHLAAYKNQVHEFNFRAGARVGQCFSFSYGSRAAVMMDNWFGNVVIWMAPAGLESIAEQAAYRMISSFDVTPQLNPIVMQDEARIAANGNMALANQQQWFAGQQIAHRTQSQIGDIIANQYWERQGTDASFIGAWEHNQHVIDRVMERGSEARRGQERLYDDSLGREYYAPAGANYYWVDSTSGNVFGTETDTPPDYNRDYRMLSRDS